jgi:hypothetical protein
LRVGGNHSELSPRQCVDPLRISERRLLQPEPTILLFQIHGCGFELLNLIAIPNALEVLPREQEHKKKNQYEQSEETETFTTTHWVNFPYQTGIVDLLYEIEFREICSPCGWGISRTPSNGW